MDNKILSFIEDTILHKQYVLESGKLLSEYLIKNGEFDLALELLKRCAVHDNSKFEYEEIMAFASLDNSKNTMKDPNASMDDFMKKAISIHWKNNRHHPEYYDNLNDMTLLDILEMACDCYSRSLQFGTDLLSFIEIRQKERFNMPEDIYESFQLEYEQLLKYLVYF